MLWNYPLTLQDDHYGTQALVKEKKTSLALRSEFPRYCVSKLATTRPHNPCTYCTDGTEGYSHTPDTHTLSMCCNMWESTENSTVDVMRWRRPLSCDTVHVLVHVCSCLVDIAQWSKDRQTSQRPGNWQLFTFHFSLLCLITENVSITCLKSLRISWFQTTLNESDSIYWVPASCVTEPLVQYVEKGWWLPGGHSSVVRPLVAHEPLVWFLVETSKKHPQTY